MDSVMRASIGNHIPLSNRKISFLSIPGYASTSVFRQFNTYYNSRLRYFEEISLRTKRKIPLESNPLSVSICMNIEAAHTCNRCYKTLEPSNSRYQFKSSLLRKEVKFIDYYLIMQFVSLYNLIL